MTEHDRIPSDKGSDNNVDVKDVLRSFGWKCGPEFDKRYHGDAWVFNLVNIIERQARLLSQCQSRLELFKEGAQRVLDGDESDLKGLLSAVAYFSVVREPTQEEMDYALTLENRTVL